MCFSVCDRSLNGSVDSGAGDVDQLGEFGGGMCPCPMNFHQVTLLGCRQFRLLAAGVAFRFSHLHSLSRSGADEVGFELCHHRENVEQQSPDRVGRIVDGSADAECDALDGELVHDIFRIPQGASQPVEFRNHKSVPVPAGGQGFSESGSCPVGAGESVVGVDQARSNAEGFQGVSLSGQILLVRGYACVSDQEFIHNATVLVDRWRPQEYARKRPPCGHPSGAANPDNWPHAKDPIRRPREVRLADCQLTFEHLHRLVQGSSGRDEPFSARR